MFLRVGYCSSGIYQRITNMARARPQSAAPLPERASAMAWIVPLAIALVTLITFAPALTNGFVSWDDGKNFVENQHYRGLGPSQLEWMWTTFHMGHYVPLTWMTLGADYLFWGMNPAGYHATSIL